MFGSAVLTRVSPLIIHTFSGWIWCSCTRFHNWEGSYPLSASALPHGNCAKGLSQAPQGTAIRLRKLFRQDRLKAALLEMEFTTRFKLQSQATRLVESAPCAQERINASGASNKCPGSWLLSNAACGDRTGSEKHRRVAVLLSRWTTHFVGTRRGDNLAL